jgi:hypothetical protein
VAGLALKYLGSISNVTIWGDIVYLQPDEVTGTEFAIDRQIKEGQVAAAVRHLKSDADRPDFLKLQRWLLADELAFVPWVLKVDQLEFEHACVPPLLFEGIAYRRSRRSWQAG